MGLPATASPGCRVAEAGRRLKSSDAMKPAAVPGIRALRGTGSCCRRGFLWRRAGSGTDCEGRGTACVLPLRAGWWCCCPMPKRDDSAPAPDAAAEKRRRHDRQGHLCLPPAPMRSKHGRTGWRRRALPSKPISSGQTVVVPSISGDPSGNSAGIRRTAYLGPVMHPLDKKIVVASHNEGKLRELAWT